MKTKIFVLALLCLCFGFATMAQRVATTSGNWNDSATWGGAPVPSAAESVTINSGVTVSVNANAAAASMNINGTLNVGGFAITVTGSTIIGTTGTLSISSATGAKAFNGDVVISAGGTWNNTTAPVTIGGSLTNNGTFTAGTGVYTFNGADKTISGSLQVTIANLTVTGSLTNLLSSTTGGLTINTALNGTGSLTNGTNSLMSIFGTATITTLIAGTVPNTVIYNMGGGPSQNLLPATYYNLLLNGSSNVAINDPVTINGDLTIDGPKVTWTGTGNMTINGNLLVKSEFILDRSGLIVNGITTISGTLNIKQAFYSTFNDLVVAAGGNIKINTQQTTVTINGNIEGSWNGGVKANTFNLTGTGKTITGTIDFGPVSTTNITGTYTNNGILTFAALNVNSGAVLTNNNTVTVMDNLATSAGTGTMIQGENSLLRLNGGVTITDFNAEATGNTVSYIGNTQTIRSATYYHLILDASGTKSAGGALVVKGDFTMNSASVFVYGAYNHDFYGNWNINSTSATPIISTSGSTINFKGNTAASISGSTAAVIPFVAANISNSAGLTINKNVSISGGSMIVLAGGKLTLPPAIVISGTGTFDLNAGGNLEIGSIQGISAAGPTGNVQTGSRIFNTAANYTYNGSSSQISGTGLGSGSAASPPAVKSVNNLIINNAAGITLSNDVIVSGILTFLSGRITTAQYKIILDSSAEIAGAGTGKYIFGNLRRHIRSVPGLSIAFPVGDATIYSPATIDFSGTPSGGSIDGSVSSPVQPPAASGILQNKYVNRSWTLNNNGVSGFTSYNATFNYVAGDVAGGADPANFIVAKNSGGTWTNPTVGVKTTTSTQASGLTSFSDFMIGEPSFATKYLVSASNYSPVAGSVILISAQLTDVNGNAINKPGVTVTWSKSDLNGSFASPTSTTDANGLATVAFTSHTAAATATTVTATDAASLTGTTPTITTVSGAAAKYLMTADNYAPVAGSVINISAQLADINNNPVTTPGLVVTWSKSDPNGSFAGATSTTDANGLATVAFTSHTAAPTATTITANDAASLTGTTPTITTVAGAAAKYLVTADNYAPVAGSVVNISAQLADINNNPVTTPGLVITWSKSDANGSFASATSSTDANGLATVAFTSHTAASTATTVTATDAANLTGTTPTITTVAGAAAKYLVTADNYAPVAGSVINISAQLADINNNPVTTPGLVVTWSKSDPNGSFASATSTTDANGIATIAFTTHTTAGSTTTITATDPASLTGTTPTITTVAGAAAKYLVTADNYAPVAGSVLNISAQLADINNNPVTTPGLVITWSKSDPNGAFASATSSTDANGLATVAFTSHTAAATATTVTASDAASLTGTTPTITTVAGAAAKYLVTADNYAPVAGSVVNISAQLADINNNPVTTPGLVVTWSKSDASGSFASATSATDANGLATVAFTSHTAAATATTVTASDAASLTGTTPTITTVAGAAAKYLVTADNYAPVAGSVVNISAQLADINNNPVNTPGLVITWSKSDANGSFASATSMTDANGLTTVAFTSHTAAATATAVTATDAANLTGTTPTITTVPGAAAKYLVTADNYAPVAGSVVNITAQLADINNNPVTTPGLVITWSKSDPNGSFASATSTTDANGLATVAFTSHTAAATATTVTASDAASLSGTTPTITTVAGAAARYLVTADNYAPVAGSVMNISAQLADINNNPVTTPGLVITWSKSDPNGSFASPTSMTDANGLATVAFTSHTAAGTATTVAASDAASLTGTTPTITTVAGAAAKYLVTADNYSPVAGSVVNITAQLADINNNPVATPGLVVTWSKSDPNGSFAGATSTTDANGLATVAFTSHTGSGTATTVTATDAANLTGTTPTITIVAGAAAKYLVTADNYSPVAGSVVNITAQLADINNNPVTTPGLVITWSKSDTNGSFASSTSTTDANGLATIAFTTHTTAGSTTTITATDGSNLTGTTPTITTVAGAAAKYLVTADNYSPVAGSVVNITAQLADINNNPVTTPGLVITWSKSDPNGSFAGATSSTDANGLATVAFTSHTAAATATTVTASDAASLTGTTPTITTVAGAAAKYLVTADNYAPVAGSVVNISAQLADINNNPVTTPGLVVTWSKSDPNGSFAGATSTTDANGIATVAFTSYTASGTITTITATCNGNLTGESPAITTVPGAAAKYLVTADNYAPVAGSVLNITAQLADINNNPVTTPGLVISWSKSDANGSFASATSITDANGIATVAFTSHTAAAAATATTVTASDAASLTGTTPTITTVAGAAAKYLVTADNYAPVAGSVINISAQLADINNNPVNTPGLVVTWSKSDPNGSFASATSTTDANGLATVAFTSHTGSGTITTITAICNGDLTGVSPAITTVAGAAAKYLVTADNYAPVAGSVVNISAQLADINNNPVTTPGLVITWSKSDPNGSFASATSTTDANGLATVAFTSHTGSGTATTVTATDATNLTGTTPTITTVAGAAAKYLVTADNYAPVAGSVVNISAQLADVNNNPVTTPGLVITWSKSDPNGSFASATSITDANGLATVAFTSHTTSATITTITATCNGNLTGVSAAITTVAGAAAKYLVAADNYAPVAGSVVNITAQLADINNNPVTTPGLVITWSKSDPNGCFASATSTTDANGLATVAFTSHTGSGTATTVTASDAASLTGTTPTITTVAGAAAKYLVTADNYAPVAGSVVNITAQLADNNNNPVTTPGLVITWSKSDPNGAFAGATSTTDANGLATVAFTSHTGSGTATTVTATDAASLTGTTPTITTVAGAAAKYLVTADNYTPVAGSVVNITAQLADINNNPVATPGLVVTWSKSDPNGSFASATSTTDANGIATVAFTSHTASGTITTITATCNGNLTGESPAITTIAGAAAKYLVTADNYSPVAGSVVNITAQLADINNNPLTTPGLVVTWSKSDLNGSFAGATSTTSANGIATVAFTSHTGSGTATTVTASDAASLTGTTPTITTVAGAAAKYLVTADNYAPVAGSVVNISAQLADINNNPVTTPGLVITWSKSDPNGSFAGATSTTDGNGIATVAFTSHTGSGTATTVTASDAASLTGTTPTITTVAGAAAKYLVTADNYAPVAGSVVNITAQLADINNNPVTTPGLVVTWSKSDPNGSFAGATSLTDANGIATMAFTSHTAAATITTVTATDAASLTGTTPTITTVAGAAAKYLVTADNYSPVAGSVVNIIAQLADNNNNPVATPGLVVTWSKSDANGSFASATSTTDANGLATVAFTSHTGSGTATTVTASDAASLTGTTPTITTVAGAAAKYLVTADNYSPVAGSVVNITAQLADINNNPVATAGLVVTWSKSDANGSFASATSTTDGNGIATVAFTSHTGSGTATTVTASDAASLTGTTPTITTVAGAAAKYLVTADNYAPVAGSVVNITAQLADINNNPVTTPGLVVTWSKSDPNGSFASSTSTTGANGLATVAFTSHTAAATATTVTASDAASLTGTTPTITTVAGAAAKYLVTADNYAPIAGSVLNITAQLADINNNPVTTPGLVITWSKSDASGSFASSTSSTDANGLATVAFTSHTAAATATTVTARDAASLTGTTPTITTLAGAAAKYLVTADNYAPVAGSVVNISAQLADVNNNPVTTPGLVVTWSKSDANGSFAGATSMTDANGIATMAFTSHTAAATATTVTATDAASLTGTTPTITTVAGAAAKYLVTADNYSPVAGSVVNISAQLADINNNPVTTPGLVITWSKSDPNGAFASATSMTDANGLATVAFTSHTAAATITTVTATDAASLTGTTPIITTVAGAAAKYLVIADNYAPVAGSVLNITAQLADINNNPVTTPGLVITWSKSDPNGSFASATSSTDANGLATVAFTSHTAAATATTVTATDAASLTGTTPTIGTINGQAVRLVITGSSTQIAGESQNLVLTAKDANDNTVPEYSGDKSLVFQGASASVHPVTVPVIKDKTGTSVPFGSPTVLHFTNGVVTAASGSNGVMVLYAAENAVISATDNAINTSETDRLKVTVQAAAFSKLAVVLEPIEISSVPFSGTNQLIAQDAFGNTVNNFNCIENKITVTTSLNGIIYGLSGSHILNQGSDFKEGMANLSQLGLTFTGEPATGTFTFTPSSGTPVTSDNVRIQAGTRQATPSFSPTEGAIAFGTTVTISSAGADAIYYTTDGTTPTTASTNQATSPLIINSPVTVKALAVKRGSDNSLIGMASYTQDAAADLADLQISDNPTNFAFSGNIYTYNGLIIGSDVPEITITPIGTGIITIENNPIASGTSMPIRLTPGTEKTITIVVSENGKTSKTYTVNIKRALSSSKAITAYTLMSPQAAGIIDEKAKTILLTVPFGTNLKSIVPTIVHSGASVTPASGIAQTFSAGKPVTYTVTAADGSVQDYAVSIIYKNNPPTDIQLVTERVFENQQAGIRVGTLTSTSADKLDLVFEYNFVPGTGDSDNDKFIISDNEVRTRQSFDFETRQDYSIRIRSTSQQGLSFEKTFTIHINDVNEPPSLDLIANQSICYTTDQQVITLTGITAGPEAGQSTIGSVSSDNNLLFKSLSFKNNQIHYSINEGQSGTATLVVKIQDNGGTANGGKDEMLRTFSITVNPLVQAAITSNMGTTIAKGEVTELVATGGTSYQWFNSNGVIAGQTSALMRVRPMQTTNYTVLVTNASGCTSAQTTTIHVEEDFTKILPSNNFSPNGDQINDTWTVENIDAYPDHKVSVYDRAGRVVFTTRNYRNDWNGTVNGSRLDEGTYYYLFEFDKSGVNPIKGFITIVY